MSDDIQLADLLEAYPIVTTPGFQTIMTSKKEFSELSSSPTERLPPGQGHYFKHQRFTHRFLRSYDDLVILSETGSGKSCEVLGFIEYTRKELEKARINPLSADEKAGHFKRVIVLVKGRTQKNEFRNQLVCKCSDGRYITDMVKKTNKESVQKSNLTLEIKKAGYNVTTYKSFTNSIRRLYPTEADEQKMIDDFSDTIFWIDEAHNLLIDNINNSKRVATDKEITYNTLWKLFHIIRRSKRIISTATPMLNDVKEIGSLMNLILPIDDVLPVGYNYSNATNNDIRVLFPGLPFDHKTATREQISPYFKGQFPASYDFGKATLEDLEPYFRGRIGFIRASDTGAIPIEEGIKQNEEYTINGVTYQSQLVLYNSRMSDLQTAGYLSVNKKSGKGHSELFGAERQAANFVFPDGYSGGGTTEEEKELRSRARKAKLAAKVAVEANNKIELEEDEDEEFEEEGSFIPGSFISGMLPISDLTVQETEANNETEKRAFRRYVEKRGDNFKPTAEFIPWLSNIEYIRTLSCKYAEILDIELRELGNAFIYDEFIEGSGVIVLALCLEGLGFQRYNESLSMFTGSNNDDVKPVCSGNDKDITTRKVRPEIRKQMRYGLITGDITDTKFQSLMEAMNSYENRHGDYIKILLSSRAGRDGINVNNVLRIHLIGPEWNQSAMYQAISRGIRATSHEDLIREEQEKLRIEGKDPATVKIPVRIYKHSAIPNSNDVTSIDIRMYRLSEFKDRNIRRMMRILKQCAIGCQVHYNRNVKDTDTDFTPTCDYDVCKYKCVDPPPTFEDFSSYDIVYSDEIVHGAYNEIVDIFRQKNLLSIDEITKLLPQYRKKYIIMALEKLINNKIPLVNRFGYITYLCEDNQTFYLNRTYPNLINIASMSYYSENLIGVKFSPLNNIVSKFNQSENKLIVGKLELINPNDPQFISTLDKLSIEGQVEILENVIIRSLKGESNSFIDTIINKYKSNIFFFNEPVAEINKVYEQLHSTVPRRGRKRDPNVKRHLPKINPNLVDLSKINLDTNTEIVYLHTLYSKVQSQTQYSVTSRANKGEGRTRILKTDELSEGWFDVNETEFPVYNILIQIEISKRNEKYRDMGIYGFELITHGEKVFRISDSTTESTKSKTDARNINRGKVCESISKAKLFEIMWKLEIPTPPVLMPNYTERDRNIVIDWLLNKKIEKTFDDLSKWSFEKLIYFYKWFSVKQSDFNKIQMCEVIKNKMIETGRMVEN